MEKRSAALGAVGTLVAGALAFGGISLANAQNAPAPAPSTVTATTEAPAPAQEPVVTTPAPEPTTEAPAPVAAEPAPVVAEPAPVVTEPAPVYVEPAPEPVAPAPVVVAPEPAPQQTFIAENTDAKVAVDANGYIIGGPAPMGGGDGPGKVDMPSK